MRTLLLTAALTFVVLSASALTGCETFAGRTSIQAPPNPVGSGNTENSFNGQSGAYDEQTPVGVDNAAAAGR